MRKDNKEEIIFKGEKEEKSFTNHKIATGQLKNMEKQKGYTEKCRKYFFTVTPP
jgi:hypothetical protein